MNLGDLNLVGVIVAFGFSFVSGAIWFGPKTFYPVWMRARGISTGQLSTQQNKPILLFGGTVIGLLVQLLCLGILISTIQENGQNFSTIDGALVGLILGVGIAAFASLSHRLFGGESIKVWLIETTNDSINLTVAGAIITYFN